MIASWTAEGPSDGVVAISFDIPKHITSMSDLNLNLSSDALTLELEGSETKVELREILGEVFIDASIEPRAKFSKKKGVLTVSLWTCSLRIASSDKPEPVPQPLLPVSSSTPSLPVPPPAILLKSPHSEIFSSAAKQETHVPPSAQLPPYSLPKSSESFVSLSQKLFPNSPIILESLIEGTKICLFLFLQFLQPIR